MLETVVIALFAVALALLLLAGALALLKLQFLAQAARADGTVVSLRPDGGAGSSGSSQLLCPIVRFMTKRGEEVEFAGGPASSPPRYRIGDVVPVRYRPSDPAATARVESFRGLWLAPALLAGLAIPLLIVAIGLLIWQGAIAEDVAQLRRSGMKTAGVITRIDLAEADGGDQPSFVLTIEVDAPSSGRRLALATEPIEAAKRRGYTIGDRVPVLIDPQDPTRYLIELP